MLFPVKYNAIDLKKYLLIDVRSPKEYSRETIPGSINLPLFSNDEQDAIGHIYKKDPRSPGKRLSVEIVSKKLPEIYDKLLTIKFKTDKNLLLFCDNGGIRSTTLALLMHSVGVNINYLDGGYNSYRKHIVKELPKLNNKLTYLVIHGKTGSGKTLLLNHLKEKNMPVLDFEQAANHRGSLLGSVGLGRCHSTKQFESNIYDTLKNIQSNYVFVEAESRKIGHVYIPKFIHQSMKKGKHIYIETPLKLRSQLLIEEYMSHPKATEELINGIKSMDKYINEHTINRYISLIKNCQYETVAKELMTEYYDPMYVHKSKNYHYDASFKINTFEETTMDLIKLYNTLIKKTPSI